jgi:hypothetical protein
MVLHHMGSLHPYETALVLLIAFGPLLVVLWLVLRERRRTPAAPEVDDVPQERIG